MRIIRTETEAYKFHELTDAAREKALAKLWDINGNFDWWDSTYEDAKNIGLEIIELDLDCGHYAHGKLKWDALEVAEEIIREHGEQTDTHKTALRYLSQLKKENDGNLTEEREGTQAEFLNDLLEDYRIILEKEYNYLTSEAAIIETIEANDYEFTKDGRII